MESVRDASNKTVADREQAKAPEPTRTSSRSPTTTLLGLQRDAGNRAVARLLANVQRTTVDASFGETLYNRENGTTGEATAGHFTGSGTYDITRQDDNGVTVEVKIRFVSQSRNTTPPVPPATTPRVGALIGPVTAIPEGDTRRDFATTTMTAAVQNWNGRLTLVGTEAPAEATDAGDGSGAGAGSRATAPTQKRLPVTFVATPVWTLDGPANAQVVLHPSSVVGGSTGNPIDAGNFYERRDESAYPAQDSVIYAHEYGHLLGIPDEYSQSNQQMNLLLHQASPTGAAAALQALDRTTVERMVLRAMAQPLYDQLTTAMGPVITALQAQRPKATTLMTAALRTGIRQDNVTAALRTRLEQLSADQLHAAVPRAAAFETTANFSPRTRATEGVGAALGGDAITNAVGNAYWRAAQAPSGQNVAVDGLGDVRINVSSVVGGLGTGTGSMATPAAGVASTTVTAPGGVPAVAGPTAAAAGGGAGAPALPAIAPSPNLIGQLSALPAAWGDAGSALDAAITPEAVGNKMTELLQAANVAAELQPVVAGVAARPRATQIRQLYIRALRIVTNLSNGAAQQIVESLITDTVNPTLTASIAGLQTQIHAEVERVMHTPPGTLAAAPADPNMAAMVAGMKARLDADKAATAASSSRDPLGAGQAAPDQDVTYSYQGLMGSNRTTALRADQMAPIVAAFNTNCRNAPQESMFTAETR